MTEVGDVAPLGQCGQDGGWSVTSERKDSLSSVAEGLRYLC